MKVKFVVQMEIDDMYSIDDDTGEKFGDEALIVNLKENLCDGDFPITPDEVVEVEVTE